MTKQQTVRCICFCLVVCLMLVLLCDLFENERTKNYDSSFYTYRTYPENVVDAVFIGTSGVDRYWCGPKAYEDYGMTVFPLSTDGLASWLYTDVLEYALKYQNPEMVLLDIRGFCQDTSLDMTSDKAMDMKARRFLDALPWFSPQWFKVAFKSMRVIHSVDPSQPRFDISLLFSFIRFHPKWESASYDFFYNNLGNMQNEFCGFYMCDTESTLARPQTAFVFDDTKESPMDPLSEAAFYEIIETVQEKGLKLLLVDSPQILAEHEMLRVNYIYDKLDQMGVDYVSYYTTDEDGPFTLDLSFETDFYDPNHSNFFGAVKFTDALAAYIDGQYDLPDRRNDPVVQEHWGGVYEKITATIEEYIAIRAKKAAAKAANNGNN